MELWRVAAGLGVPGLALAVYYLLSRSLGHQWRFSRVSAGWVAPIIVVYLLSAAAVVLYALHRWAPPKANPVDLYYLRILVIGPNGLPVEDATVWSSVGGESRKIKGGWELEISAAKLPEDRKLFLFAAASASYLRGEASLHLGTDPHAAVTIHLSKDSSARIRGVVTDQAGGTLSAVRVTVEGYPSQVALTSNGGAFELPAQAAHGEPIYLRAEKEGYRVHRQIHPAGQELAFLVMERQSP